MLRKSILVISDQHAPYHHIDTLDFLSAIKEKYKPDCVVNIGDEMDWHSISFHDSHPIHNCKALKSTKKLNVNLIVLVIY